VPLADLHRDRHRHSDRHRVVITGFGVVSPNGVGVPAFTQASTNGVSGIAPITGLDLTGLKSSVAGQCSLFNPASILDPAELRRVPRMIPMALAASREALEMASFRLHSDDLDAQRTIGVALGTGGGGLGFVEEQYREYFLRQKGSLYSITAGTHGNLSSELSIHLRLRGPSHVLSTGCTSSTDAIGYAMMLIRSGTIPAMLACGADSPVSHCIIKAFELMRVVSTRRWDNPAHASRPFDKHRDGFVVGEGAWMFILESLDHALQRGATPLAELAGYASTCDAYHRVQIAPDVTEPVRAIELALKDAGAAQDDVGYINLHGTSTEMNDRMETLAIHKAFGPRAPHIPCSSTKSMIGHPQGACGAAGLAATLIALRTGLLPPTIHLATPDPACDLDYIPHTPRQKQIDLALCNCIAFGSKNSALVLKRP